MMWCLPKGVRVRRALSNVVLAVGSGAFVRLGYASVWLEPEGEAP